MRVGIVGSRSYPDWRQVIEYVRGLPTGSVVVSGGARGVDTVAVQAAKKFLFDYKEHFPNLEGCVTKADYTGRYYERNGVIVSDSDRIVAFTEKSYGGTWNTIKQARAAGKPVEIITPKTQIV